MTRPRSSSRTARSRPRLLRAAGALCLGLLAGAAEAIVTLPANVDLWHQTSGQQRCVNIGDWYTSQNSCGAGTIVGNPGEHTFVIRVPPSAVAGGPVDIVVLDAESVDGANDVDEVQGPPDPVRFWL